MESGMTINPEGCACYLCGPYGGDALYAMAESVLREIGAEPINPNKAYDKESPRSNDMYAANIMRLLKEADILVLLPGWENDGKAVVERMVAKETGILVCDLSEIDGD